jgi:intracellular sulfur oxidation DsrE/DsrF family protein
MSEHARDAGKSVHILLCGGAVGLALQQQRTPADADTAERRQLLQELLERQVSVGVCPEYLSHHGLQANTLMEGVTVTDWPQTIRRLMRQHDKFMVF